MKLFIFLFMIIGMSGCATTGAVLTAFGEGWKEKSQEPQKKQTTCFQDGGSSFIYCD